MLPEDSLRDTIEAAVITAEKAETGNGTPENVPDNEGAPDGQQVAAPAAPQREQRVQEEVGKPAPTLKPAPKPAKADGTLPPKSEEPPAGTPPAPGDSGDPTIAKPPGTWTPQAREHWGKLPSEVRGEVWKREREASRALTSSAEARRFEQEFGRTIQPFLGFIAAEKSTPLQAVKFMMETGAALRVGTPQQKVQVVADVIRSYGIDLQMLDTVLAGKQSGVGRPEDVVEAAVQRAIAPIMQSWRDNQQSFDDQARLSAEQDLDAFAADPKHEFYADVAPLMADIIEVAAKNGTMMGLTEAYERATLLSEPVRRVIEARKSRQAADTAAQVSRRARGAAVSVTPSAEANNVAPKSPDTLRGAIEAAIDQLESR